MKVLNLGEFGYSLVFNQSRTLTGSTITLLYTKPDGTQGSWTATIDVTDATSFYYTLQEDDIDTLGIWVLDIFARWSGSKELWTRTHFRVINSPIARAPEET